jgi:hypothetical protein
VIILGKLPITAGQIIGRQTMRQMDRFVLISKRSAWPCSIVHWNLLVVVVISRIWWLKVRMIVWPGLSLMIDTRMTLLVKI